MRVVFVWTDLSTIGGVSNRIRKTIAAACDRDVKFVGLSLRNANAAKNRNILCFSDDPGRVEAEVATWTPSDTVVVLANSVSRLFPTVIDEMIARLPIIYMCSGQMAFFVQHSKVLLDRDFVENLRASMIISFSDADIIFQRQLGIHGQIKGYVPVNVRARNGYSHTKNVHMGFVGRIDYKTKDCLRLIDVARSVRERGLPALKVYTTDGSNSPDYHDFLQQIANAGVADAIEVVTNETDHDKIYGSLSYLLLPSKLESFGNVVLEAFSYGIPVISTTYAPGPAEVIEHGRNGFLLDSFNGESVFTHIAPLKRKDVIALSRHAFGTHKKYSMEKYLAFMEGVASDVLKDFKGTNDLPVMPWLLVAEVYGKTTIAQAVKRISPPRIVKNKTIAPLKWVRKVKLFANKVLARNRGI